MVSSQGVGSICPWTESVSAPPALINRAALLPGTPSGCETQASTGKAATSACRRATSKSAGSWKKGRESRIGQSL
jgi:hypothetical protein